MDFGATAQRTRTHSAPTRLVQGHGRYTADIVVQGMMHAVFVRAPAGPAAFEISADSLPVGAQLFFSQDLAIRAPLLVNPVLGGSAPLNPPPLPAGVAAALGQPIAIVVAATAERAHDAADAVVVRTSDADAALPSASSFSWSMGDIAAAEAAADLIVTGKTVHARLAPSPMEPRAAIAIPTNDGLHVITPTQAPWRTRDTLAHALGLDPRTIRVEAPDVGGAFGMKASPIAEEIILAAAALTLKQPLRWAADRGEDFLAAPQGRGGALEGALMIAADGTFLGLRAHVTMPTGHMLTRSGLVPLWNAARILPGPYDIPAVDVKGVATPDNGAPVGIYRGAGRPEATLLMEHLVAQASAALGMDAIELRRRNIVKRFPAHRHSAACIDSGDYDALLTAAAKLASWTAKREQRDRAHQEGSLFGLGAGLFVEPSGRGSETARVRLLEDGQFIVSVGCTDQGQGRTDLVRQFSALALGVPENQITVRLGDTAAQIDGLGALASRSTPIGMTVLKQALDAFVDAAHAATRTLDGASTSGPAPALPWHALTGAGLDETVTYHAPEEAWGSGVAIAEVTVDAETGVVTVTKLYAVDDAGKIIHPTAASAQITGGAAQGLGEALMERLVFDDGELITGSFMDYALPRADDIPHLTHMTMETPAPGNPLGAKGIGEAGCIGVPAAILNAVHDALRPLGVTNLTFPLTPCRVWEAIRAAQN